MGRLVTFTSSSGYPNLSLMNSMSAPARWAGSSNARAYVVSVSRNVRRASGDARVGWAAIIQEGQGVRMFPICADVSVTSELHWAGGTYETCFAGVDERLRGEPLPHERAGGPVIHGVDQAADVVVDCEGHSVNIVGLWRM